MPDGLHFISHYSMLVFGFGLFFLLVALLFRIFFFQKSPLFWMTEILFFMGSCATLAGLWSSSDLSLFWWMSLTPIFLFAASFFLRSMALCACGMLPLWGLFFIMTDGIAFDSNLATYGPLAGAGILMVLLPLFITLLFWRRLLPRSSPTPDP